MGNHPTWKLILITPCRVVKFSWNLVQHILGKHTMIHINLDMITLDRSICNCQCPINGCLPLTFPRLWKGCFEWCVKFSWTSFEVKLRHIYRILKHGKIYLQEREWGMKPPNGFSNYNICRMGCTWESHVLPLVKKLWPIKFTPKMSEMLVWSIGRGLTQQFITYTYA